MKSVSIFPAGPLFSIDCESINIGNFKYGNLERAREESLFGNIETHFSLRIQERAEPRYPVPKFPIQFYGIQGEHRNFRIVSHRSFPAIPDGYLEITDLETDKPTINFNRQFRYYSLTKLSKSGTIGEIAADISTLKLLDHGLLSFHGGAVSLNGRGIVITGLPDVGKTYSIMRILRDQSAARFIAEDIVVIDPDNCKAYAIPFTQTVEKRRSLSPFEKIGSAVYNSFIRHNFIKADILQAIPDVRNRIAKTNSIDTVVFLKHGRKSIQKVKDKNRLIEEFVRLNNLEFPFSRNVFLLSALYFGGERSMVDYLEREKSYIEQFILSCNVVEIYAEDATEFPELIFEHLGSDYANPDTNVNS